MLVIPDSTIELYGSVPITGGREVVFSSEANQRTYFVGKRLAQNVECTYVRKTGVLKIEHPTRIVAQCNFIGFKNSAFENKWIYARIMNYEYINNVTTEITYAIDWFQTYMFNCNFFSSQIEREHLSETDWNNAIANPFRQDILELNTPEDIAVGSEDYQLINESLPSDYNNFMVLPDISGFSNRYVVPFGIVDFGVDIDLNTPLGQLVQFLNTFESQPVTPTTIDSLLSVESGRAVITPTNLEIGRFPNTVRIFLIREKEDLVKMIDLMSLAGVTNNIIGIYYIPGDILRLLDKNGSDTEVGQHSEINYADKVISPEINPKLARAPFSYIEVRSPDGNVKELHYENFVDLADGKTTFEVSTVFTIHGTPLLSLIPYKYKTATYYSDGAEGGWERFNYNIKERLDFGSFPQVGYSVDAYLTFLSSIYNETITNRSLPKQINMGLSVASSVAGLISSIGAMAGGGEGAAIGGVGIVNTASSFAGGVMQPIEYLANESAMKSLSDRRDIGLKALKNGDSPADLYGVTKEAYSNDEYHAGTGGNYSAYDITFTSFNAYFKRINTAKTNIVKNYLDSYGYKSGRIGVPRVCNYIGGSGNQPHFVTIDGKPSTYVKTAGMIVEAPNEIASTYIEMLFDKGCRFVKGD